MAADHTLAIFAAELILLLLVGRVLGEGMNRLGQPALFGQLLAGVLLGPSVFGLLLPELRRRDLSRQQTLKSMIDAVSQIGILLLLLLTGMETNLALVNRRRRAVISSSLSGIAVPFACGVALGLCPAEEMIPGARDAARDGAVPRHGAGDLVGQDRRHDADGDRRHPPRHRPADPRDRDPRRHHRLDHHRRDCRHRRPRRGELETSARASPAPRCSSPSASPSAGALVARVIVWSNDNMTIEVPVITAILLVMLMMALTTELIGVHTALGAFVAGMLIGQSPILTEHIEGELRGFIIAFFSPVFFAVAGLGMDLRTLMDPTLLLFTLAVILVASIGKFLGALVGGRLGGLNWRESLALATGLNARGSTEVIIASIGLSMGALSKELYTMIVAMAVVTTMIMPPTLRWMLARVPLREDEAKRLEKEEAEADAEPAQDGARAGLCRRQPQRRLAARLAGLFAVGAVIDIDQRPLHLRHALASARPPPCRDAWQFLVAQRHARHHPAQGGRHHHGGDHGHGDDHGVELPC